jgi:Tfp pilus assembly protein PilN
LRDNAYQEEKIKIETDKEISEVIKKFLSQNKLIKPQKIIIGLPRYLAMVKYLTLPSQDESEIKKILRYEITNLFLYRSEDLIWDWGIIEKRVDGYSELILIAIQKEIIFKYISYIKNIGLIPDRVILSTFSIYNQLLCDKRFGSKRELVVYLEDDTLEILVVDRGKIIFTRGTSPVREERLTDEIKASIDSYQKETKFKAIDDIILVTDREKKEELSSEIEKVFTIQPQIVDSVSVVKGLFLKEVDLKLNLDFLPSEIKSLKRFKKRKRQFMWLFGILLALFSLVVSITMIRIGKLKDHSILLAKEIRKIQPKAEDLKIKELKINLINEYLASQISTLDILTELYQISPQDLFVSRLFLDRENLSLIISGEANSFKDVFLFMSRLEESKLIKNPKLRYTSLRKLTKKEVVSFEIVASF